MRSVRTRIRQLGHLGRLLLRRPGSIRAIVTWKPFSITSYEVARALRAWGVRPRTIIDGGANVGQFARAMVEVFPEAHVYSFEPLPVAARRFRRHLQHEPRCSLFQIALGSSEDTVPFYAQQYDLASSVLRPAGGGAGEQIEVPVTTLDAALASVELVRPILLKLDLQGFELEALKGAEGLLAETGWVLLEVGFRPSYEGEATFEQLYDFLHSRGFRFRCPIDVLEGEDGGLVQMDMLFERLHSRASTG